MVRWAVVVLVGCGTAPGEVCDATGDGFTRRDPCRTTCVEWELQCVDGTAGVPGVCAGDSCADDADCPEDWGCAQIDLTDRVCLPSETCPDGFVH